MKNGRWLSLLMVLVLAAVSCTPPGPKPEPDKNSDKTAVEKAGRPATWAVPIRDKPGLENLYKVSDVLYRGEQPEDVGFPVLKEMGIKTVVNLRTTVSDRKECSAADLGYVRITVQTWDLEDEEVIDFLEAATNPENQPVFVHCKHGADRTGLMVAAYRLVVEGWTKEAAIEEMTEGGYGFHLMWRNIISYVRSLDVEWLKSQIEKKETEE